MNKALRAPLVRCPSTLGVLGLQTYCTISSSLFGPEGTEKHIEVWDLWDGKVMMKVGDDHCGGHC